MGFLTCSIVPNSKNWKTTFPKFDLFPCSGKKGKTPILLGPLERANLNHCIEISSFKGTQQNIYLSPITCGREQIQFLESFSQFLKFGTMDEVLNISNSEWDIKVWNKAIR
jgi:hypothetical protein